MVNRKTIGKKNRQSGARFELKVRKDLESKGWIVDKWGNNVEFTDDLKECLERLPLGGEVPIGKLIPAKHKFQGIGRPMAIGTGFPDFIALRYSTTQNKDKPPTCTFHNLRGNISVIPYPYLINMGVEVKSNSYLTKEEKEKCKWLLKNNIFSKILIASKGIKRGEIKYLEFKK